MSPVNPIGIFDSGVGGLSVLKEIRKILPFESVCYFADSWNCPYGSMDEIETLSRTKKNIAFLLKRKCKIIVIACNTVTAVAIENLRSEYNVPFIGMEPALKSAVMQTRTKKVGILATENTFNGELFKNTFKKYAEGVEVFVQPGFGLVELVENQNYDTQEAKILLEKYINPMIEQGADIIVLGCTHYPFLTKTIQNITGSNVMIIDPSDAVAVQTRRVLTQENLIEKTQKEPVMNFFTTGSLKIAQGFLAETADIPYQLFQLTEASL